MDLTKALETNYNFRHNLLAMDPAELAEKLKISYDDAWVLRRGALAIILQNGE